MVNSIELVGFRRVGINMQQTSIAAYLEIKKHLGKKQREVKKVFEEHSECTNNELANYIGWPINTITPRVVELREKGFIKEHCRRADKLTGRKSICWTLWK